jgi:hypothetical protein
MRVREARAFLGTRNFASVIERKPPFLPIVFAA